MLSRWGWPWPRSGRGRRRRRRELSVTQRLAGPARGRGRHPGAGARVPGRAVLRERLAHDGRDGRHRHPAAEAARLRLVRRDGSGSGRRRGSRAAGATRATSCRRSTASHCGAPTSRPTGAAARCSGSSCATRAGQRRTVTVMVDAHSELMTQYPWGFGGTVPNASDNAPDTGVVRPPHARLPRHRPAAGRGGEPLLHGDRRLRPQAGRRRDRPGPLRPERRRARVPDGGPARADAERVRRRPVRPRHRRAAALPRQARAGMTPRRSGSRSRARRTRPARRAPSSRG